MSGATFAAVDPLVRRGLRPRRLLAAVAIGVAVGLVVVALLGDSATAIVLVVAIPIVVLALVGWVVTVLYLRTDRGQGMVQEHLAEREAKRRPDTRA
jgi:uncharacterized membrane protein YdjX (TVP38/TMEM64 family)